MEYLALSTAQQEGTIADSPLQSYLPGDCVSVRSNLTDQWHPARVVRASKDKYVKVAMSLPCMIEGHSSLRLIPTGTPYYLNFHHRDIRLTKRDPNWDPFSARPFMTPDEYVIMGGEPQLIGGIPGLTHVGAYISGTDYDSGDLAWAWEGDWRKTTVISGQRSWIAVRFIDDYRLPRGRTSKSFRPTHVWPVICDHPEPVQKISLDDEWRSKPTPLAACAISAQLGLQSHKRIVKRHGLPEDFPYTGIYKNIADRLFN